MKAPYLRERLGRRSFLAGSAGMGIAGAMGLLLPLAAGAQPANRIHALKGDVRVNGKPADAKSVIGAGDSVKTGPDGQITFVLNGDAFFLRADTELRLERAGAGDALISGLRLLTGAIGAAFGKGRDRRIFTPTVTAGIRGTGIYAEAGGDSTYFCTCYGAVDLETSAGNKREKVFILAGNHHARRVGPDAGKSMRIETAPMLHHTNEDMIALESAAGRPDPFKRPAG